MCGSPWSIKNHCTAFAARNPLTAIPFRLITIKLFSLGSNLCNKPKEFSLFFPIIYSDLPAHASFTMVGDRYTCTKNTRMDAVGLVTSPLGSHRHAAKDEYHCKLSDTISSIRWRIVLDAKWTDSLNGSFHATEIRTKRPIQLIHRFFVLLRSISKYLRNEYWAVRWTSF